MLKVIILRSFLLHYFCKSSLCFLRFYTSCYFIAFRCTTMLESSYNRIGFSSVDEFTYVLFSFFDLFYVCHFYLCFFYLSAMFRRMFFAVKVLCSAVCYR